MKIIGKTTINPFLFYSGKTAGYLLWIFLALNLFNIPVIDGMRHPVLKIISVIILLLGLALTAVSLFNLGKATSLGVPDEDTTLKTDGLYRFSRNPMYLGFNCITIAALLFNVNAIQRYRSRPQTLTNKLCGYGKRRKMSMRGLPPIFPMTEHGPCSFLRPKRRRMRGLRSKARRRFLRANPASASTCRDLSLKRSEE